MNQREQLIALCERAVVPVENWRNRDSSDAQKQVGEALMLLRAGAEYVEATSPEQADDTIWIYIYYPGFTAFEYGSADRANWERELFYIPTAARLDRANGKDWY
jgi:hypothetical protein